jgi:hypothetical protein
MIKAGTGWLFDQLQHHPDFWMPPVKEIRYLGVRSPEMRVISERWRRLKRTSAKSAAKTGLRDDRDYQFLLEAVELSGRGADFYNYSRLFRHKGNLLSGDISPGYCVMSAEAVSQVAANLPQAKVILLVRDPVARAWSGISMLHRHGKFDATLLDSPDHFRAYYEASTNAERRSYPSRVLQRWRQHAPQAQFRYFFFDDLSSNPDATRAAILRYLGADPEKSSGDLSADYNRKANTQKLALPESIKAVLVEHFKDELRACADLFGGPAREWPERYGL